MATLAAQSVVCLVIQVSDPLGVGAEFHQTGQIQEPSFFGINRHGKLRYSWAVGLGPFKPGRGS